MGADGQRPCRGLLWGPWSRHPESSLTGERYIVRNLRAGVLHRPKVFYGWWVVGVGFYADLILAGAGIWAFGVFIVPIAEDMGWSITTVTLVVTIRTLTTGLIGPVIGPILDRPGGARWVMTLGAAIGGLTFFGGGLASNPWHLYLTLGALGALGTQASGLFSASAVASKRFVRYRGRAIGILTMGLSAAGFVLVPPLRALIDAWDWRVAMMALGVLIWVTLVPLTWLVIRGSPEEMGLRPDGEQDTGPQDGTNPGQPSVRGWALERSWTVKEAIRTKALWLIVLGQNLASLGGLAVLIHLSPFLERQKGLTPAEATSVFAVYGLAATASRIPWGLLAERIPVRFAMGSSFIGTGVALFLVSVSTGLGLAAVSAGLLGIATGGFAMFMSLIWPEYFGREFIGTIRGVVTPMNLVSSAGGPLLAAWIYDTTQSYTIAFSFFMVVLIMAGIVIYTAAPPKAQLTHASS